jgi:hypothetical protein
MALKTTKHTKYTKMKRMCQRGRHLRIVVSGWWGFESSSVRGKQPGRFTDHGGSTPFELCRQEDRVERSVRPCDRRRQPRGLEEVFFADGLVKKVRSESRSSD